MSVVIRLSPELRDTLLSQIPPGLTSYRALETARLIRGYRDRLPLEYNVECDEDVAQALRDFAAKRCPEAVWAIEFALRLGRSKEIQPRQRGWFR